jgi:hypothetical protein
MGRDLPRHPESKPSHRLEAGRDLSSQDVSRRWQDHMARLLDARVPDAGPPQLEQIFRLD